MNNFGIWGGETKSRVLGAGMGLDRSPCRQQEAVQDPAAVTPDLCWEGGVAEESEAERSGFLRPLQAG